MTDLYEKRRRHRHMEKKARQRGGRGWSGVAVSHGMPRNAESWKRQRIILLRSLRREHGPVNTLVSNFWPPKLGREWVSAVLSHPICVIHHGSHRKWIYHPIAKPSPPTYFVGYRVLLLFSLKSLLLFTNREIEHKSQNFCCSFIFFWKAQGGDSNFPRWWPWHWVELPLCKGSHRIQIWGPDPP